MISEKITCQNCKNQFVVEPADFDFYKRINVPPPTFCPQCRLQRRFAFRNERSLYRRQCDSCRESIIAMFSPDKPFKVYCHDCFFSDKWDPMEYGREYDFSKPFFTQWQELQLAIPQIALFNENSVNSPWVNYELDDKNCYLNFGGHYNEDCAYNQYVLKCKNCLDNLFLINGQLDYENIWCENCHKTFFSTFCFDCQDTYFSFDCRGCSNIFGCTGLRHKQNYIFNQPVSKEDFQKFLKDNQLGSHKNLHELERKAKEFWKTQPQRAVFMDKTVNSTGNIIKESKNCTECWNAEKTEDSKWIVYTLQVKDSYDTTSVWWGELCYEFIAGSEQLSNIRFSRAVTRASSYIEYSDFLTGCHDCFGCFNLKQKKHCIFNKQYSEKEYEELRGKIIKHMEDMPYTDRKGRTYRYGEFFPYELSAFGYNETVAHQYFPLTKNEALVQGFNWSDYEADQTYQFSNYEIPDSINDVKDDILEKILKCEASGKAYRLISMELTFYRRFGLPIPRLDHAERHKKRLAFVADHLKLNDRTCGKCGEVTRSVYTKDEFPIVYCEKCYLKTVA